MREGRGGGMTSRQLKLAQQTTKSSPEATHGSEDEDEGWKHPAELIYSVGRYWTDKKVILYLISNALAVNPTSGASPGVAFVTDGKKTIAVNDKYRIPIMFVSKWQFTKLKSILTADESERARRWPTEKYEILHIARVWKILTDEGPSGEDYGLQFRIEQIKQWRCWTLERVLTRFRKGCFSSEPSRVAKFWDEYGEAEYMKNPLEFDWRAFAAEGHEGVKLTDSEIEVGLDPKQLMEGLKEKDGHWFWSTDDHPVSGGSSAWYLREEARLSFSTKSLAGSASKSHGAGSSSSASKSHGAGSSSSASKSHGSGSSSSTSKAHKSGASSSASKAHKSGASSSASKTHASGSSSSASKARSPSKDAQSISAHLPAKAHSSHTESSGSGPSSSGSHIAKSDSKSPQNERYLYYPPPRESAIQRLETAIQRLDKSKPTTQTPSQPSNNTTFTFSGVVRPNDNLTNVVQGASGAVPATPPVSVNHYSKHRRQSKTGTELKSTRHPPTSISAASQAQRPSTSTPGAPGTPHTPSSATASTRPAATAPTDNASSTAFKNVSNAVPSISPTPAPSASPVAVAVQKPTRVVTTPKANTSSDPEPTSSTSTSTTVPTTPVVAASQQVKLTRRPSTNGVGKSTGASPIPTPSPTPTPTSAGGSLPLLSGAKKEKERSKSSSDGAVVSTKTAGGSVTATTVNAGTISTPPPSVGGAVTATPVTAGTISTPAPSVDSTTPSISLPKLEQETSISMPIRRTTTLTPGARVQSPITPPPTFMMPVKMPVIGNQQKSSTSSMEVSVSVSTPESSRVAAPNPSVSTGGSILSTAPIRAPPVDPRPATPTSPIFAKPNLVVDLPLPVGASISTGTTTSIPTSVSVPVSAGTKRPGSPLEQPGPSKKTSTLMPPSTSSASSSRPGTITPSNSTRPAPTSRLNTPARTQGWLAPPMPLDHLLGVRTTERGAVVNKSGQDGGGKPDGGIAHSSHPLAHLLGSTVRPGKDG